MHIITPLNARAHVHALRIHTRKIHTRINIHALANTCNHMQLLHENIEAMLLVTEMI